MSTQVKGQSGIIKGDLHDLDDALFPLLISTKKSPKDPAKILIKKGIPTSNSVFFSRSSLSHMCFLIQSGSIKRFMNILHP